MIEVKNISKNFERFAAVSDVSFGVADGEAFALLGPNGSGKTTILKMMVGLTHPTCGQVLIDEFDVWKRPREAKRLFSYLPQRVNFYDNLTAEEVLEFYCRLRRIPRQRINETLHSPDFDFNGFAQRPVSELSGGMLQRLGLAVACLPDAPVLILDEPTISLDPDGAIHFREFLSALRRRGKTIIFSSHMLADVEQLADRVAILVGGRLVAQLSLKDLRDELMRSSRMRVVVRQPDSSLLQIVRVAGADNAILEGDSLVVTSSAEDRFRILSAIETRGGGVIRFGVEEMSLEDIYLRYVDAERTEAKN